MSRCAPRRCAKFPEHAYEDDPIHEAFGVCDASLHAYFAAWIEEQVLPPLQPNLHVAVRGARVAPRGAGAILVSDWTLAPGERLAEPVVVHVQEDMDRLFIRLEVDSLEGAPRDEGERVLRTIVRRGIRTSGSMTWNGASRPYAMRLTPYDAAYEERMDEEQADLAARVERTTYKHGTD